MNAATPQDERDGQTAATVFVCARCGLGVHKWASQSGPGWKHAAGGRGEGVVSVQGERPEDVPTENPARAWFLAYRAEKDRTEAAERERDEATKYVVWLKKLLAATRRDLNRVGGQKDALARVNEELREHLPNAADDAMTQSLRHDTPNACVDHS
jgi:hypothetical protein